MGTSSSKSNKLGEYYNAYKSMIHMKNIKKNEISFDAFLINTHSIPNFMKLISSSNDKNDKKISKNSFKNYVLDKKIKLHYLFEECEYILDNNLEKENTFIIVDKSFFEKLNLKINALNQKNVIINIDKKSSSYSIKFPLSNKSINFIELTSGIYQFNRINNNNINQLAYINNSSFLNKIKSKYIVYFIATFIKDKNYLLKLIKNSKYLQKKFDINLSNYKEIYTNKRFHYEDFLSSKEKELRIHQDLLYYNLKDELLQNQINDEDINKFAKNYFIEYYNNLDNKEDSLYEFSKDIDFSSPFFNILGETEIFSKLFNIKISRFKQLNILKIKYHSIIVSLGEQNDINMIKELKIDLSKLKKFALIGEPFFSLKQNFNPTEMINSLNINTNLVYFQYELAGEKREPSEFKFLNEFKSLKYLELSYVQCSEKFELKLKNLKHLKLISCENISFSFCDLSKIKFFQLKQSRYCLLNKGDNPLLEFPNLNTLIYTNDSDNNIIDFRSLKSLKKYEGYLDDFLLLEETSGLNQIILISKIGKKSIEKLMSKFPEKNYSITKLELRINQDDDLNLNDFLNIFTNLSDLTVETSHERPHWTCGFSPSAGKKKIIITQNKNSKIKNIKLFLIGDFGRKIEINCESYSKIQSLDIYVDNIDINSLPFFQKDNKIIFNSLTTFKFSLYCDDNSYEVFSELMENFSDNIEKMPNLINLYFSILYGKESKNITQIYIEGFIYKIISLKSIKNIFIQIGHKSYCDENHTYSKDELKKLFPKIDFNKFHKINICKRIL